MLKILKIKRTKFLLMHFPSVILKSHRALTGLHEKIIISVATP